MAAIVDFMSFRSLTCDRCGSDFIVKELTIIDIQTASASWFLFQSPCAKHAAAASSKVNKWLTHNFHGLAWEDGYLPYELLQDVLSTHLDHYTSVYVKGKEKADFLQARTTAEVIDLTTLGCPSLRKIDNWTWLPRYSCLTHKGTNFVCSRDQAFKLFVWFTYKYMSK